MPRYTSDSRERVRDAIDFVELVNARTELRKSRARAGYTGLCPFHDERTPSFGIDPVEKLYHCFGCGEGGDVFKFVMETEGLDFGAALESLADRAGVELEHEAEDPRRRAARPREPPARPARAHRRVLRARAVGVARGRRRARVPARPRAERGRAAPVPRRLLAVGVGHASSTPRGGRATRTRRSSPPGSPSAAREGADLRRLPRQGHVPAGRPRAGACAASGRGRCATARARSTSTPARARSSRRAASCSASTSRARPPRRPAR